MIWKLKNSSSIQDVSLEYNTNFVFETKIQ